MADWFDHRHHPVTESRMGGCHAGLLLVNCRWTSRSTAERTSTITGATFCALPARFRSERNHHRQVALLFRALFQEQEVAGLHTLSRAPAAKRLRTRHREFVDRE